MNIYSFSFVTSFLLIYTIDASPYYIVKHDRTQNADLRNEVSGHCYVWTCSARNELSTCAQGCSLSSENVTVPKGLRHAETIRVRFMTLSSCGKTADTETCQNSANVILTMVYTDSAEVVSTYDQQQFLVPNWTRNMTSLFNSNQEIVSDFTVHTAMHKMFPRNDCKDFDHSAGESKNCRNTAIPDTKNNNSNLIDQNLVSIKMRVEPYKFCGRISSAYVYIDACVETIANLVVYPYSTVGGRVNASCVDNATPLAVAMDELYGVCLPSTGYSDFKGICECDSGYILANDGISCKGEYMHLGKLTRI